MKAARLVKKSAHVGAKAREEAPPVADLWQVQHEVPHRIERALVQLAHCCRAPHARFTAGARLLAHASAYYIDTNSNIPSKSLLLFLTVSATGCHPNPRMT